MRNVLGRCVVCINYYLTCSCCRFITVFLGVVVLGLAFQGMVINNVQNEAVENMAGTVGMIDTWMARTGDLIGNTTDNFDDVSTEVSELKAVLGNMKTDDIKAEARAKIPLSNQESARGHWWIASPPLRRGGDAIHQCPLDAVALCFC